MCVEDLISLTFLRISASYIVLKRHVKVNPDPFARAIFAARFKILLLSPDQTRRKSSQVQSLSWLVKRVIKRSASSCEDLKTAMPFARARVLLQF